MTFQPGQSGNPGGRKREKPWRDALERALGKPDGEGKRPRLEKIAEACVAAAEGGDKDAWNEIANRLDGKPAQAIIGGEDDDPPVRTVNRIELVDLVGGSGSSTPKA